MDGANATNADDVGLVGAYTAITVAYEKCSLTLIFAVLSDTATKTPPAAYHAERAKRLYVTIRTNAIFPLTC